MNWTDPSADICAMTEFARENMRFPTQISRDPACSEMAVDLLGGGVWLKQSGELLPENSEKLKKLDIFPGALPPDCSTLYWLKTSGLQVKDLTEPVSGMFNAVRGAIGNPQNSLTNTLVGSGLGALGGYGLGTAADMLVPRALRTILPKRLSGTARDDDEHELIGQSHWAPTLAVMGGLAGATPGLLQAGAAMSRGYPVTSAYPWTKSAEMPFENAMNSTGAMFQPTIPVDAFNRAVWSNVMPNPFGTKSQWGTNEQDLFTPPQAAAVVSGLVSATGAAKRQHTVSPWDVAQVASQAAISGGMGAVMGAATGLMTGKILGALAGLTPAGQQYAQQTGLWAGLMRGVATKLF